MKMIIKGDTAHLRYNSLKEFFEETNPNGKIIATHSNNIDEIQNMAKGSDPKWRYGDESRQTTFYHTRFDPTKGKSLCADEVKRTMQTGEYKDLVKQAMTYRKRTTYKDSGFRLSVPKAISGEDRYFTHYSNSRKPIVKIAINICGSASVDKDSFVKVAKTAVPTIIALETAGIATEVWYCAFAVGTHEDVRYTATEVCIKSAEQRFNWTTFAPVFTLGSYRESVFMSWCNQSEFATSYGLGRPMEAGTLEKLNNYDYTSVIGLNAQGPVKEVNSVFSKIKHSLSPKK